MAANRGMSNTSRELVENFWLRILLAISQSGNMHVFAALAPTI